MSNTKPFRPGASVSVTMPVEMPEMFVALSTYFTEEARSDRLPRVPVRDVHERALNEFLRLLAQQKGGYARGFRATPTTGKKRSEGEPAVNVRKTVWLQPSLLASAKKVAAKHEVTVNSVVLTAFYNYLDQHQALLKRLLAKPKEPKNGSES